MPSFALSVTILPVSESDAKDWQELRSALWPDGAGGEHEREIAAYFAGRFPRQPWCAFLARTPDGDVVGLAEVGLRAYAEGCTTTPVAYLEGWYVREELRRRGVGRALVAAVAAWGRAKGARELASDTDPENAGALRAHAAAGFADAGTIRCFRLPLEAVAAANAPSGRAGSEDQPR